MFKVKPMQRFIFQITQENNCVQQVFGKDFTLCLIMSLFQLDPIMSGGAGVKVSSTLYYLPP